MLRKILTTSENYPHAALLHTPAIIWARRQTAKSNQPLTSLSRNMTWLCHAHQSRSDSVSLSRLKVPLRALLLDGKIGFSIVVDQVTEYYRRRYSGAVFAFPLPPYRLSPICTEAPIQLIDLTTRSSDSIEESWATFQNFAFCLRYWFIRLTHISKVFHGNCS